MSTPVIESRLPNVGTTIFTVMSALAQELGAINLGQGFPDFEGDPALVEHVAQVAHVRPSVQDAITGGSMQGTSLTNNVAKR